MEPTWMQIVLGSLVLMAALNVIRARNPVIGAIMLMMTLFLTGALYFSLGFFFVGAVQILIYAGAISVLFIFIVMLLDLKPSSVNIPGRKATLALATVAALLMLASLVPAVFPGLPGGTGTNEMAQAHAEAAQAKPIALIFLSKYMVPFQVTGLLILASVMGVAVLGRQQKSQGTRS